MKAAPCAPLLAGSEPNCRSSAPIGALDAAVPAGTTSMTGARSRLTPAARSSVPQPAADCRSVLAGQPPCSSADGMVANPGPVSCWICPPSWLAAMKNLTPPVPDGASDCMTAVRPASVAVPAADTLSSSDPKW